MLNNWGPTAIIVLGYMVGLYFQNRYVDAKISGLQLYLDARLKAIEDRLDKIEARLDRIEAHIFPVVTH